MIMIEYILLILASYRISYMLLFDDGPGSMMKKIRNAFGVFHVPGEDGEIILVEKEGFFPSLFSCMNCMSVWVGIFFAISYIIFPQTTIYIALPFSLSAGALLIDKFIDGG